MSQMVEFEITVECAECGGDLATELESATRYRDSRLKVGPCAKCVQQAADAGRAEGDETGYDRGFSEGEASAAEVTP